MVLRLVQVQEFGHQHYAALSKAQLTADGHRPADPGRHLRPQRRGPGRDGDPPDRGGRPADHQGPGRGGRRPGARPRPAGRPPSGRELTEPSGFVYLAHRVPDAVAAQVTKMDLNGINLVPESQRVVPVGLLAEPVVGTVGWNGAGTSGIEYQYQSLLAGKAGHDRRPGVPRRRGAAEHATRSTPAQPGTGLELTLDESVQYVTEQALAAEIVASHATVGHRGDHGREDRRHPGHGQPGLDHPAPRRRRRRPAPPTLTADVGVHARHVGADPGRPVRHPARRRGGGAVRLGGHPGLRAGLGVQAGDLLGGAGRQPRHARPRRSTVPAALPMGKYTFHDAEAHGDGDADRHPDPRPVVEHRDHRGGRGARARPACSTRSRCLGFGQPTGLGIPGESEGLVPGPSQWTGTSIGSTPIGQDDAVTAQQVLDAYNAVANGGVFVSPRLDPGHRRRRRRPCTPPPPSESHRVIDPDHQRRADPDAGVGGGHRHRHRGRRSTGTPWPARPARPRSRAPTTWATCPGAYVGSFAGFAPAQDPVLSAIVVLDHPTPIYGGAVAAPVFSTIMSYALHHYGIPTTAAATTAASNTAVGGTGECHRAGRSGHGRPLGGPGTGRRPHRPAALLPDCRRGDGRRTPRRGRPSVTSGATRRPPRWPRSTSTVDGWRPAACSAASPVSTPTATATPPRRCPAGPRRCCASTSSTST